MKPHRLLRARGVGLAAFLLPILLLQCLSHLPAASALEATFTPNPADDVSKAKGGDGGPLPVSLQQRKQLLELEAAIVNSQDPQATLSHVAQQNQLSPEDLVGMLDRNRRDLQESGQLEGLVGEVNAAMQAGGGGGGRSVAGSLPRRILSLIASIFMALFRTASVQVSRNPKQSTLLGLIMACGILAAHNAPRNGIVISSGASPSFFRGHTTLLEPPVDYLQQSAVTSWEKGDWVSSLPKPVEAKSKGSKSKKKPAQVIGGVGMTRSLGVDTSNAEEGEVTVDTYRDKDSGYQLVSTAQTLVTLGEYDGEGTEEQQEEAIDCMLESITAIFEERKFSEFVPNAHSLKLRSFLVASGDEEESVTEGAVMAMKLLGDFGRYGVQPLCLSYEMDGEDEDESTNHCVAFHTLKGGHFDGELRFLAQETESGVALSVTLAIPKGGRSPPVRLAESMVSALAHSMAQSIQMRTKQTLARRSQSKAYRVRASGRASKKRHLRYEQEKAQEEMAVERKRKWKRNNPDAGSYRPSGHRLRSPGGGPAFS
ncbi:hypothetical protein ACHAXT_004590 [Thalassiosira profunda]